MAAGIDLLIEGVASLQPGTETAGGDPPVAGWGSAAALAESADARFLDRQSELDVIRDALRSPLGPYFWLVVAPPGLGKTTFLNFLAARLMAEGLGWDIRSVDVRGLVEPFAGEPAWLVARFFSQELDGDSESDVSERVAKAIVADGRSYLCLLDSAELLSERFVVEFRRYFSEIYQLTDTSTGATAGGRVALVVASRLESGWRGVIPAPRLRELPLTALTNDDVGQAVRHLAMRTGKELDLWEQDRATASLGKSSAGVPELLASCLAWLQESGWHRLDLLEDEGLFQELGHPFVQDRLLSADSLLPLALADSADTYRQLVEDALRLLAPYRRFTQSHLRQHLTAGGDLADALVSVGWSLEDLWSAIAGSALLYRPLDEFWQALQPTIRELLFRYFYPTDELRARAQIDALAFDRSWSQEQAGTVQVAGLVECVWHEASALRLISPDQREVKLPHSARALASTLRPSASYAVRELQQMLGDRLNSDADLWDLTSGTVGLLDKLINVVTAP